MTTDLTKHFAAYVSAVPGALVRRYGTLTHIGEVQGAERPPRRTSIEAADGSKARPNGVDPAVIVPLTHEEWRLYGAEYARAIREGSLKSRKASEWIQAEADALAAETARAAKLEAEAIAKAKASEAQPEPIPALESTKKKGS